MVTRPSELEATARTLYALAERAVLSPTLDAVVLAESAASVARATGATALEFEAERLGARMTYALGDLTRAEARFRGAAAAARALGDGLSLARVDASLAFLAYDRGDALSAEEQLDAVSTSLDRLPHQIEVERHRALVDGYRGNLARQAGDYEGARAHYLRALARAETCDALVPRATFAMDLGATELASGRPSEAALWLARAARSVEALHTGPARTLLTPLVAHYRALLMLSSGERDASLVEIEGPAALLPIRAWLYDAMGTPSSRDLGKRLLLLGRDGAPFEHARFGVTLLAHLRGGHTEAESAELVFVARDGSLIVRGHRSADLSRREPLRRIVQGLARADVALGIAALVSLGWPGERMNEAAAKNRVHVALSTLRSAGLSEVLVRVGTGYALDRSRVRFL